jgi:long-chain acyl-CoA synthetase
MTCYYKQPELTAESIDAEGFFHTGDIAQLNEDGTLSLIDRRKNLFKLSQGEYVPCELLETLFSRSSVITQCLIHGESTDSFVIALVVPNLEVLSRVPTLSPQLKVRAAAVATKPPESPEARQFCNEKEVVDYVHAELIRVAQENDLPGFQRPRAVYLDPVPWTVELDLATPTFKLKRPAIRAKYAAELIKLREAVAVQLEPDRK